MSGSELGNNIKKLARMSAVFWQELMDAGVDQFSATELTRQYMYLLLSMRPPVENVGSVDKALEVEEKAD